MSAALPKGSQGAAGRPDPPDLGNMAHAWPILGAATGSPAGKQQRQGNAIVRRTVIIASLGLMLVGGAWAGYSMYAHAKSIRKLPVQTPFREAVTAVEPLGMAFRAMLMKPGSDEYHRAIVPWLFHGIELDDNGFNRRLVENLLMASDIDLVVNYIRSYPVSPTHRLTPVLEALLEHAASFDNVERGSDDWYDSFGAYDARKHALALLGRYPEGRQYLERWIAGNIVEPRDPAMFAEQFSAIANIESVDLRALVELFEPEILGASNGADGLRLDWASVDLLSSHIDPLIAWGLPLLRSGELDPGSARPLIVKGLCRISTKDSVVEWFRGLDDARRVEVFDAMFGGIDEYGPKLSEHGVERHESSYDYFMSTCVADEFVELAWSAMREDPARQLAMLHAMWHSEHPGAVPRIEKALAGGDSAIRKGVVVLLARHKAAAPAFDVDDAFRGSAPRLVLFKHDRQYRQSVALQRYEALSGHDYGTVGKRFPPSFGSAAYGGNDAAGWRAFVEEFPWYVSTDDAYYRLAYEHFLDGDMAEARAVIDEYRSRTYIDADASPYMDQLELLVDLVDDAKTIEVTYAPLETMLSSAWLNDYSSVAQRVENAALITDLMYVFDDAAAEAGIAEAELVAARQALDSERTLCDMWDRDCSVPDAYETVRRKILSTPINNPIIYLAHRIDQ